MEIKLIKREEQVNGKNKGKMEKRMREAIKTDMLGVLIENFKAIDREFITERFDINIHGYEKNKYYQNFIQIETFDLAEGFSFINDVKISEYGFAHPDVYGLSTKNNNSSLKVKVKSVKAYEREVDFEVLIEGQPDDISIIAEQCKLEITLEVTGISCWRKQIWQESLFNMYHLYKIGNLTGAFMNAFIAFEGFIRSLTQDYETKIAELYSRSFKKPFTAEMRKYKNLRNDLMHGNENEAYKIKKADIINVLVYLLDAYYYAKEAKKVNYLNI